MGHYTSVLYCSMFYKGKGDLGPTGVEYPSIYFTNTRNRHVFCFLEHLTVHRNIRGLVLEATKCISISIISVGSSCFESDQIKRPSFVTLTGGGVNRYFHANFYITSLLHFSRLVLNIACGVILHSTELALSMEDEITASQCPIALPQNVHNDDNINSKTCLSSEFNNFTVSQHCTELCVLSYCT